MANQQYTYKSGGQTYLATPTAQTTAAQQQNVASNPMYSPVPYTPVYGTASGQYSTNPSVLGSPSSIINPIAVNTANAAQPAITMPQPPTYTNPGSINTAGLVNPTAGMTVGADGKLVYAPPPVQAVDADAADTQGRAKSLMMLLGLTPKKESALTSPEVLQQQAVVQQQRATLNDYTAQLNSVIAKQQQDLLSTRGTASAQGVTEAVYGGIAAQINREAAIKALPLQAAVAAAQGNVQLAQEYLGQVMALKTEQVTNDYAYKVAQYNAISDFVNNEQKIRLESKKTEAANAFELKKLGIQNEYSIKLQEMKQKADADALKKQVGTTTGLSEITGKPLTDTERQAQGYATRAQTSSAIISNLEKTFASPMALGGILPNQLKSSERQQFEQAQRDFVNAVLRKESGAAISESEFDNARKQYFPQAGDSNAVLKQKALNRTNVINSLRLSGGLISAIPNTYGLTQTMNDGTVWKQNDDGSMTRIK